MRVMKCKNPSSPSRLPFGRWLVVANCVGLLAVAIFFRAWQMDRVPGVNGDEAWIGVQALEWLDGGSVAWRTPTGNPMNVFHFVPQALLHRWFAPSVTVLRFTALMSGLLALLVNFTLCWSAFDRRVAVISTLTLAVLPINIAYSRFAWDASQSLLFTLPAIYFPIMALRQPKRRAIYLILGVIMVAAAIVVHPTNVFVAPLLVVSAGYAYRSALQRSLMAVRHPWRWRVIWGGAALATVVAIVLARSWFWVAARRVILPRQFAQFFVHYVDLLSGTSVYRYIVGSQAQMTMDVFLYRSIAWAVLGFGAMGAFGYLRRPERKDERVALAGALLGVFTFFLIGGPESIEPHYERYGLCLVGTAALFWSIGVIGWWERHSRWVAGAAIVTGWLVLAGFQWNYFSVIRATGGLSHATFRTGAIEPKVAAARLAGQWVARDESLEISASEWWNYWPLKYFTFRSAGIDVTGLNEELDPEQAVRPRRGACFVEFSGSERQSAIEHQLLREGHSLQKEDVRDASGRSVLTIMRIRHNTADGFVTGY